MITARHARGALLCAAAALALAGCGQRIRFDEAAVEVVEVGDGAGVQEQEIGAGRYWAPPFSYRYIVKFPTTLQTYKWDGYFQFINADRVQASQAMSMNVQIRSADADNIVRKYKGAITKNGGGDGYVLDDVVYGPITREIQQAFVTVGPRYTSAQLYADGGRAMLEEVRRIVAPKFERDGILITDLLSAGPPKLPDDIVATIKASLLAVENAKRKDAELAATVAEGKKTVAQASADAEARRLAAESIRSNPEILKLEELKVHRGICPLNAKVCVVGGDATALVQDGGD
jgi:hypothetical protein